ncbi:MAG: hypothetical protein A4E55_01699 [Pelotomaculum sp. PtaU1.Bin035]|nr:MAG: hypothetical protein A4E55_01699 [Pelotomaculum sp. PtaU1.Bin035]
MAFEVYKPKIEKEATVSISKNHITLNKKLISRLNTSYVELAYDPDTKTIRIKTSTNENGLIVNKNRIGTRGFFKHFNIQNKGKYNTIVDENENAIYIYL